jgi:hypothetical protein
MALLFFPSHAGMSDCFAYLAQGKLHVKDGPAPVQVIESQFGNSLRQREQELQQRHAWKTRGRGAQFMSGGMLWGGNDADPAAMRIHISSLSRGCSPGELLYTLETPEVGGLFAVGEGGRTEQRLFHTADYRVGQVRANSEGKIAFVVMHRNGTSSVALMSSDGSDMAEVSQGDSLDAAPSWVPGCKHKLVFQSSGIARNPAGYAVGRAPATVQLLDIEAAQLETVAEDGKCDLLGPQVSADGWLYYIRRPYRDPRARVGLLRSLLDLALLPFRLLYAIFHYLNHFTMAYGGKTLTSAGGAMQRSADLRRMMIWGNIVDAEKAAREHGSGDETPSLVPKTWELVRQSPEGKKDVIARGVLSFDLSAEGTVLYSNGSGIFRIGENGQPERLHQDTMIEQVVAI